MSENAIGQVTIPSGGTYNFKDLFFRNSVAQKKVAFVAGCLRFSESLNSWYILDDDAHTPLNMSIAPNTVTNNKSYVAISHPVNAIKCISLIAVPDDTYALQGVTCGASVGLDLSTIYINLPGMATSQITNDTVATTYDHAAIYSGANDCIYNITKQNHARLGDYLQIELNNDARQYSPVIVTSANEYDWKILGLSTSRVNIQPWLNGVKQTLPLTAGKVNVFLQKQLNNAVGYNDFDIWHANIWVFGIFEVAGA